MKVGDIVICEPTMQYASVLGMSLSVCTKGKARIKKIHPSQCPQKYADKYYLVGIKGGSNVDGWVSADFVTPVKLVKEKPVAEKIEVETENSPE